MPLLGSNVWGYMNSRHYRTAAAKQEVRALAALGAWQVFASLQEQRRLLPSIIAGNQLLFALMRADEHCHPPEDCQAVATTLSNFLRTKQAENSTVLGFSAVSPSGTMIAASTKGSADLAASRRCFSGARQKLRIVALNGRGKGAPVVVVGAPVTDLLGTGLGVLCARFKLNVDDLLAPGRPRGLPARTLLIDGSHHVVWSSDGKLVVRDPEIHPSRRGAKEAALSAAANVQSTPWRIRVEVPTSAALGELEKLKWQAITIGVLLSSVLIIAAFFTARGISRPLHLLSDAARNAREGALGEIVVPGGPREIAVLARTFNSMSLALKESHDLLERRIAMRTQELERSRAFADRLLDAIEQRVVVLDRSGVIVRANEAAQRMHGESLVGKSYDAVFERRDGSGLLGPAQRTFETGLTSSAESTQWVGDNREILRLETFPVTSSSGEVEAVVEIGRIVTRERELQAQMMYQEKMAAFGLLAAGVAHDIGNPLASIQSQLRMARETSEPAEAQETLTIVEREVSRIQRLLRELTTFTRRRKDELAVVSINQVVGDVARLLGHDPRAQAIEIETCLAEDLPGVCAKEDQIVQILLNLGVNALDAMPDGGRLIFATEAHDGRIAVRVRDTGSGLTPDVARKLFQPFFTTKPPGRGTGLGLFVTRGIVHDLGGGIELVSTGSGGTEFRVDLPAYSGEDWPT